MNIQAINSSASGSALQTVAVALGKAPQVNGDGMPQALTPTQSQDQDQAQARAQAQGAPAAKPATPAAVPDRKTLEKLAQNAQQYFKDKGVSLHFKVLENSNQVQVEMVDENTNKVIRKMPGDDLVKLEDNLKREAKGVMDRAV